MTAGEKRREKAQGRLVELPFALGDKIYWVPDYDGWIDCYCNDPDYYNDDDCIYEASVLGIAIREDGFYINYEPDDDLAWDKLGSAAAVGTLDDAKRMLQRYKERYKGENTP